MKETRDHILRTAFKLFLKKSYKDVTMKELVEKTKLSKGAFYHYFTSKESIFNEVVNSFFFSFYDEYFSDYKTESLTEFVEYYLEKLKYFTKDISARMNIVNESDFVNYYMVIFEASNHIPGFMEKIIKMHKIEADLWEKAIRNARKKGEIKTNMTDKQIAKIFIAISDGVGINSIMDRNIHSMLDEVTTLWKKFYEEIKT
jgi:TetR/AcrR family transcriptional regulator, transcriptional repressor for nem operon